jgi:hypothetical protein
MPMIDVYAAADLFPADSDRILAAELTGALLRAEGVLNPGPTHTNNAAAYIHRLPPSAVNSAGQCQGGRTWVLLTEAAEGGWGIAGTALGREEFAALAEEQIGAQTVHQAVGCADERIEE